MHKQSIFLCIVLTGFLMVGACTQSQGPSYTTNTLPSGRVIKIAGTGQIDFPNGKTAWVVRYYTDLNLTDTVKLQDEALEVWNAFRNEADKSQLNFALVSANEMPTTTIPKNRSSNYLFKKEPNGDWTLTHDPMPR